MKDLFSQLLGESLVDSPQSSAIFRDSLSWLYHTRWCSLSRASHTQWLITVGHGDACESPALLSQLGSTVRHHVFRIPLRVGLGFHGDCIVAQLFPVWPCFLLFCRHWSHGYSPVKLRTLISASGLIPRETNLHANLHRRWKDYELHQLGHLFQAPSASSEREMCVCSTDMPSGPPQQQKS